MREIMDNEEGTGSGGVHETDPSTAARRMSDKRFSMAVERGSGENYSMDRDGAIRCLKRMTSFLTLEMR